MKISQFKDATPSLRLEQYFDQNIEAFGTFEDLFGNLRRQFKVDIAGHFDGQKLILNESFLYDDGETDTRCWTIEPKDNGQYIGYADDVVGTAQGRVCGNALYWHYIMNLKVGNGTWKVRFDDWMFLQPDDVMINRAKVSRWGIPLGRVWLFFRPALHTQHKNHKDL